MLKIGDCKKLFKSKHQDGNPAIRLLNADNAYFIIAFLYQEFKENAILSVLNQTLISKLSYFLQENAIENESSLILFEDFESRAKRYLEEWTKNSWITKYPDNQGGHLHSLTLYTEKVFQFIESLERKEFVGTESRFQDIIKKLAEIIEKSNENPKERIAELENKKREIDTQIREILLNEKVATFSDTEIKERYFDVNRISRELLADFNEVKENFKDIRKQIYEKHAKADTTKGNILAFTIDSLEEMKEKDQAKSFYAFWDFLTHDSGNNQLRKLVEEVFELMKQRGIDTNDKFLPKIKTHLFHAAEDVDSYLRLIIEKLNRTLSEKNLQEHKKAFQIIAAIRERALQIVDTPPNDFEIEIEGKPNIDLPMQKQISESEHENLQLTKPITTNELEEMNFERLYAGFAINKEKLEANISTLLKEKPIVTLQEVIVQFPINQGLAELMTYFSIASTNKKYLIKNDEFDYIHTNQHTRYKTPKIIFCA
ncbi:MAG: DUF3375 domain-containing protein [Bacteroidetes bacterium]|nr:MAG: DUF3375 domain-containing protein [Bacteroidota bacterium]